MFAARLHTVAAPSAIRDQLESIWLRGTIELALVEVSDYLQRQRGTAASESLGPDVTVSVHAIPGHTAGSVGPNTTTLGAPTPAARCDTPESFPR